MQTHARTHAGMQQQRATQWNTTKPNKRAMLIAQFTMKLEKMESLEQQKQQQQQQRLEQYEHTMYVNIYAKQIISILLLLEIMSK